MSIGIAGGWILGAWLGSNVLKVGAWWVAVSFVLACCGLWAGYKAGQYFE
jgi:hypothetical protein